MNTRKLIKYIIMGAIMVLMIDSLPPKGVGDDTVLFLNPVVNPPPPDVGILLDTSGSMTSLPCAVPDGEDACGIEQNNSNPYFKTQLGYNPTTGGPYNNGDYGYDASNPTCFDSNVDPGSEGCFYGGTSAGSSSEGPLAVDKSPSGSHVYVNGYFGPNTNPNYCQKVGSKGPGGTIPSYWEDCGTIAYFCYQRFNTTISRNICINQLKNYGYWYGGNDYNGGFAFYTGNLLNFYPPKFVVTRKVVMDLINYDLTLISSGKGVRIGIFSFQDCTNPGYSCGQNSDCCSNRCGGYYSTCQITGSPSDYEGAQTVVQISPPCGQLGTPPPRNNYSSGIYGLTWNHSTPLAGAAIQVGSYFANNNTNGSWYDTLACDGDGYCSAGAPNAGSAGGSDDSWCGTGNSASNTGGPFPCEKNFMIVMTDGNENVGPGGLTSWDISTYKKTTDRIPTGTESCAQASTDTADTKACSSAPGSDCHIDEVAGFLNTNSIRPPDEATCTTNVDTYTIGFAGTSADGQALNTCALQRAAQLGQGLFAPASNPQSLENALFTFLANIIQKNRTYGTPSLPQLVTEGLNGTSTTNVFKAFIASFIPKNQDFWVGHLREYTGAASITGTISLYDKNGVPFTGNTALAGQCSFSEYVPPPIWDAGADLSDATYLPPCTANVDNIGIDAKPCYLAPNLRNVYTVTPALLSGFISTETSSANGDWTWSAGGDSPLGAGQLFTTSNTNLFPSDFGVTDTTTMYNIINYVLGPKQDGIHVLGDIFHSDPTLISTDSLAGDWVQLSDPQITALKYQTYLNAVYNRPQIVVAGADDGMIHAFYAGGYVSGATLNAAGNYVPDGNAQFDYGTGQEVWAFIPKDLLPKLQYMYNPALVPTTTTGQYWTTEGIYTTTSSTHVYYVDASPFVRDVFLQGVDNGLGLSGNAAYWHTIMIIGERLGGTYYICLDITNTLHPKFMWEFTTNNMAFTFGEVAPNPPPIGPVWLNYNPATGASVSPPQLRWVAMLNGGWDPGILSPVRGNAFYMVDIATGKLVWKYDGNDDPNMDYSTPATPIGITQGMLGTIHPWWMEAFLPDLGGQMWQFSFLHLGDNPPGVWAGSMGSDNIVQTCINPTDTNCFSGQRIFAAKNPPPVRSQAQQFYYQPSAIGDPCGDLWIGIAAGDRNNPLACTPVNYLYEINSPMPYVTQTPLLTASNLTQLTSLGGLNSGLCGAGSGWWIALNSFSGTAYGTKSLSIPYATGGVEYFSVFTPDQNACISGSSQFSCNTLGGTGTMLGMAIYQIPGTGFKTGQLVFSKQTNQGIPSPPIPVTSIVGTPSGGGSSTTPPTPFSIPSCGSGAGNMALSTQIYGATSEGAIFNVGSISGANMLMYPILQLCIPRSVENTYMSPQNKWSSHGGR